MKDLSHAKVVVICEPILGAENSPPLPDVMDFDLPYATAAVRILVMHHVAKPRTSSAVSCSPLRADRKRTRHRFGTRQKAMRIPEVS